MLSTRLVIRTEKLPYWRIFSVLGIEAIGIRLILRDLGTLPESTAYGMSSIIIAFVVCFLPCPRFLHPKQSSVLEET